MHDFYLDVMRNSPTRLEPDYAQRLLDLTIPSDAPNAPVTVHLERLDPRHQGVLKARSYVACQGRCIGRDGRVAIEFDDDTIWLGGHAVTCIEGFVEDLMALPASVSNCAGFWTPAITRV